MSVGGLDLTGYADRPSARPGEAVRFAVSTTAGAYDAALVRLRHGDAAPEGPQLRETAVPAALDGRHAGTAHPLLPGSCVVVAATAELGALRDLGVRCRVRPGLAGARQGLVSWWDDARSSGFALALEPDGRLALWVGGAGRAAAARTREALALGSWYVAGGAYDAATGRARVDCRRITPWMHAGDRSTGIATLAPGGPGAGSPSLLLGGMTLDGAGLRGGLSGRLEAPAVFAAVPDDVEAWLAEDGAAGALAAWDFARETPSDRVVDTGPHRWHGRTRQAPLRAVAGSRHDGTQDDWRRDPGAYAAIHFHADDLQDAGWPTALELRVPADARSGLHALRLRDDHGREDHIPFVVRRPAGAAAAPLAVVLPTLTYQAYANERDLLAAHRAGERFAFVRPEDVRSGPADDVLAAHPQLGGSAYDRHADGSGVVFSSLRRPLLSWRPTYRYYHTGAVRHLSGDLCLLDWLEAEGIAHDVLCDHDVHAEGLDVLRSYRAVALPGHPEYWTTRMLDALEAWLAQGGRLAYLGGNAFTYVTAIDAARPWLMEVRRGQGSTAAAYGQDPRDARTAASGELSGEWADRGRPAARLLGVQMVAEGWPRRAAAYRILPAAQDPRAAFAFVGVEGELLGAHGLLGGAAGDEVDLADARFGTPPHALRLATSAGRHADEVRELRFDPEAHGHRPGGRDNPRVGADVVFFEGSAGGAVFSVGSIAWCTALATGGYANDVARVTGNVLRRFCDPEPFPAPPR